MQRSPRYVIDPDDPRAPPHEVWEAMTPDERRQVVASLPSDVPLELYPPEGDAHTRAVQRTRGALGGFFARIGRRVYVSGGLGVYYPGEPRFCPDVLAVLDVETHERDSWVVAHEGKGLDLALEVHVAGEWKKDAETNVTRYARLGIAEYFLYDRRRLRLFGYRLAEPNARVYQPIVPQRGRYASQVLGLDLVLEADRVRFYFGTAPLLEAEELAADLEDRMRLLEQRADEDARRIEEATRRAEEEARRANEQARRAEEEARRAEEEARRAEEEARRAEENARKLAEALAEIARLKGERA